MRPIKRSSGHFNDPKPRDPAPYVDAAREMAEGETALILAPLHFNLGVFSCECGKKYRVIEAEKEEGRIVPLKGSDPSL